MTVRVLFARSLYLQAAVAASAAAYAEVARIEVAEEGEDYVAVFHADEPLDADVIDSFANHVLAETVARRTEASGR